MSWFGDILKGAGSALVGGLTSGGIGALTSSLFGGGSKQSFGTTREQQRQLNEDAAEINYRYGEKAAENAYNRQMAMYQKSYEDQSYSAMRKQMENAGLSVGLMYGGGASGGGAGQMSGAPQGATGGARAESAVQAYGLALQAKQIKLQEKQVAADAALKYAQAHNLETTSKKTEQDINIGSFEEALNQARRVYAKDFADWEMQGRWVEMNQNKLNAYFNEYQKIGRERGWDSTLGDYDFVGSKEDRQIEAAIKESIQRVAESEKRMDLMEFEKTLKNAQAYNQFMSIVVAIKRNEIEEARTEIQRYVAEYSTGEQWNWKTVMDAALGVGGALAKFIK